MDNRILGQTITKSEARTEDSPTTNRQRQIANDKSPPRSCNCDYDQLLFSIVNEQVDVKDASCSARPTMSHATHTITVPPTGHDSRPTSPCFKLQADDNSKLTYGQIPARPRRPRLDFSRQLLQSFLQSFSPAKLRPV